MEEIICKVKGTPLIKFQTKEIIDKMQKHGSIYMNSLSYYRNFEEECGDKVIGDNHEGQLHVYNAFMSIKKVEDESSCGTFSSFSGYLSTRNQDDYVFCMFGLGPDTIAQDDTFIFTEEQRKELVKFKDKALLITDQMEFEKRLFATAGYKGYEIDKGFVEYYDKYRNDVNMFCSLRKNIKNAVFCKEQSYSYQQEYRFAITKRPEVDYADHLELYIGDISKISKVFDTNDLLRMYFRKEDKQLWTVRNVSS